MLYVHFFCLKLDFANVACTTTRSALFLSRIDLCLFVCLVCLQQGLEIFKSIAASLYAINCLTLHNTNIRGLIPPNISLLRIDLCSRRREKSRQYYGRYI